MSILKNVLVIISSSCVTKSNFRITLVTWMSLSYFCLIRLYSLSFYSALRVYMYWGDCPNYCISSRDRLSIAINIPDGILCGFFLTILPMICTSYMKEYFVSTMTTASMSGMSIPSLSMFTLNMNPTFAFLNLSSYTCLSTALHLLSILKNGI